MYLATVKLGSKHQAHACQINLDQKHLEGHYHFFFQGTEIEKDRLACLRKVRRTRMAAKDTLLAAMSARCVSLISGKLFW